MNATVADGLGTGRPRTRLAGGPPAESGLRLLLALNGSGALRWAPDPDAPAMRELRCGEARLTIRSFSIGIAARRLVHQASLGPGPAPTSWQSIPATGLAEVTESRAGDVPVGSWWQGLLHAGTHLIVGADRGAALRPAPEVGPGMTRPRVAVGRDEVERLIAAWRETGHGSAESGPMSLTAAASSPAAPPPISVASWNRQRAVSSRRASSSEPRAT